MPGLVAPIANGFAGVVPFPGGHPALETVYANGLVPYPGNSAGTRVCPTPQCWYHPGLGLFFCKMRQMIFATS